MWYVCRRRVIYMLMVIVLFFCTSRNITLVQKIPRLQSLHSLETEDSSNSLRQQHSQIKEHSFLRCLRKAHFYVKHRQNASLNPPHHPLPSLHNRPRSVLDIDHLRHKPDNRRPDPSAHHLSTPLRARPRNNFHNPPLCLLHDHGPIHKSVHIIPLDDE